MAPRKLIIAMLILLGFSTGLAVFAPDPPRPDRQVVQAEPDRPARPPAAPDESDRKEPTLEASTTRELILPAAGPGRSVRARPGDRLVLTVEADETTVIEIPGLGLTGTATPYAPAIFDLLLPAARTSYEVRQANGRQRLTIEVRP